MGERLTVGETVIYVDPHGEERNALVNSVWSRGHEDKDDGCNLVFIHDDENQRDSYGRKIDRATSVVHQNDQVAPGNYWKRK